MITSLKHKQMTKKLFFMDRVTKQQSVIENYFKMFYDHLDKMRKEYLAEEYVVQQKIHKYERDMQFFVGRLHKMSSIELFNEKTDLHH